MFFEFSLIYAFPKDIDFKFEFKSFDSFIQ